MAQKQPDPVARYLGHALVGVGVAVIVAKASRTALPALLLGLFAMFIHDALDAPVSQALSDAGI
jgi:hypothetical protein